MMFHDSRVLPYFLTSLLPYFLTSLLPYSLPIGSSSGDSEIGRVERPGKQRAHAQHFAFPLQIGEHHRNISTEFPDQLAARPARWSQCIAIGNHRNCLESSLPFADRFDNRHAFRAHRQPIGGVLHVASPKDSPGSRTQRGSHAKIGIRSVCILPRLLRNRDHCIVLRHTSLLRIQLYDRVFTRHQNPSCQNHSAAAMRGITSLSSPMNCARTRAPVSNTSSAVSGCPVIPAAIFVTQEIPNTRIPECRAASTSGTVDMPTRSAPSVLNARISAGVS